MLLLSSVTLMPLQMLSGDKLSELMFDLAGCFTAGGPPKVLKASFDGYMLGLSIMYASALVTRVLSIPPSPAFPGFGTTKHADGWSPAGAAAGVAAPS